jgi:hypothetical protein
MCLPQGRENYGNLGRHAGLPLQEFRHVIIEKEAVEPCVFVKILHKAAYQDLKHII